MKRLLLLLAGPLLVGTGAPPARLVVSLDNLRNSRGVIRACLMRSPAAFPKCDREPSAIRLTVPAGTRELDFGAVPAGTYALALFHDENANGRLDMLLGIPREGFGFSGNPKVRFSAPHFDEARFTVGGAITRLSVRLQYLL